MKYTSEILRVKNKKKEILRVDRITRPHLRISGIR